MASAKTQAAYEREGLRLLKRAGRLFPGLSPVAALRKEARIRRKLRPATVRRYRPSYKSALRSALGGSGRFDEEQNAYYRMISASLDKRSGTPRPKRTSSKKKLDVEKANAEATFKLLKARGLKNRNPVTIAAALYVLVVPRIAVRPVELLTIEVDEQTMTIRNAKRKRDQALTREISLSRFSATFIAAVKLLSLLARLGVKAYPNLAPDLAFEAWRNSVAEALARASLKACKERYSLYSFRHIGIATWKSAGFSAAEIAEMAGHLSLDTAWRHYAPASSGWAEKAVAQPIARQAQGVLTKVRTSDAVAAKHNQRAEETSIAAAATQLPAPTQPEPSSSDGVPAETGQTRRVGSEVYVEFLMPIAKPERPTEVESPWPDSREKTEREADELERVAERLRRRGVVPGQGNDPDEPEPE